MGFVIISRMGRFDILENELLCKKAISYQLIRVPAYEGAS
jgi:hypothetical protein